MHQLIHRAGLLAAAALLGACAGTQQQADTPPGKHLVYRDGSGSAMRQFDYPNDDFCRRVERMAGRAARCQADSMDAQMKAKATLRYNPPGVVVEAHYADMTRCQSETGKLGPGVELISACAAK
jgi:hypothetical protein